MKSIRWDHALYGSQRVSRRKLDPRRSDESLFSLLLKMETRLGAEAKDGYRLGIGRRSTPSKLSRYIE
jgi:hypothetical protein